MPRYCCCCFFFYLQETHQESVTFTKSRDYDKVCPIGNGAFGVAFKAMFKDTQKGREIPVVLKVRCVAVFVCANNVTTLPPSPASTTTTPPRKLDFANTVP